MRKFKNYIKNSRLFSRSRRAASPRQAREERLSSIATALLARAEGEQLSIPPEAVRRLINEGLGINDIEAAPDVGRRRNLYTLRTKRAHEIIEEIIAEADAHRAEVVARESRPHVGRDGELFCNKSTAKSKSTATAKSKSTATAKSKSKATAKSKAKAKAKSKAKAKAKTKKLRPKTSN